MAKAKKKNPRFTPGQKVFHPFYGIGKVVKKDKDIAQERFSKLSIINFMNRKMKMMVTGKNDNMIYDMIPIEELPKLMKVLGTEKANLKQYPGNGHRRYQYLKEELRTGDIYKAAEILRDLELIKKNGKRLGKKEKQLLKSVREVFCEMLSDVKDISVEEAEVILTEAL